MSKIKLKPCPFCGQVYRGKIIANLHWRFECPSCGALGPIVPKRTGKPDEVAAFNWNKRVTEKINQKQEEI